MFRPVAESRREGEGEPMSTLTRIVTTLSIAAMVSALVPAQAAFAGGGPVTIGPIGMFGAQEVPGPGDPNGEGEATFSLDAARGRACFDLQWSKIRRPTAAHIHRGQAGVAGPVRVELFSTVEDCPPRLIVSMGAFVVSTVICCKRIIDHPERFYVNVHNRRYPDGAIRGELAEDPRRAATAPTAGPPRPAVYGR